jgi:hypothetical protein
MIKAGIVPFARWCRANDVGMLWKGGLPSWLKGSRAILGKLRDDDLGNAPGLYCVIIRERDYEIVRIYLGRVFDMGDWR